MSATLAGYGDSSTWGDKTPYLEDEYEYKAIQNLTDSFDENVADNVWADYMTDCPDAIKNLLEAIADKKPITEQMKNAVITTFQCAYIETKGKFIDDGLEKEIKRLEEREKENRALAYID